MDSVFQRLSGRTILVTGAAGFLGSSIVRQLTKVPCTIRRLDRRFQSDVPLANGEVAEVQDIVADVREPQSWMRLMDEVDIVFHLAGQTSAYVANEDPDVDLGANVRPVLHMMQACRLCRKHPVVVFAGTATVVGLTTSERPINESHPDHPITFYDLHKWIAEQYLEAYTREGVVAAITLRLANVYGPGPQGSSGDRGFLNAMIRRALSGEALTLFGAGHFLRDYVYVDDVARAFLAAAAFGESVKGQHFLVGSGRGTTIAQALQLVSERVARRTGHRVPILSVEPPAGLSPIEQRSFVADTQRLCAVTGWTAATSLEAGIDQTIEALCSEPRGQEIRP